MEITRRTLIARRALGALLAAGLVALALAPARADDPAALLAEGRALLEKGAAGEALGKLELALEYRPDDTELLAAAARASVAAGDTDRAYWYAVLAREAIGDDAKRKALVKELDGLIEKLGLPEVSADVLLEDYASEVLKLAQTCERRKLYANAVDLLAACRGTRFEPRADERLEKLFSKEKTIEALLASGVEIPAKPTTKRSPDFIAKEDARHSTWDDPHEVDTEFYAVDTNMGYEMAHSIAMAMEQMNQFYRKVFQYKERGGSMRSCGIRVYATREEFDEHEGEKDRDVKGFFVPLENRVATYDPRADGEPLGELWSTLFHEASHQFTEATTTNLMPGWLNEGTASYFEGALLLPSGQVVANQVPDRRLEDLLYLLEKGSPTLKEVVSYFEEGSYDVTYYPFGWGLVYFIQNYEDGRSERVYVPIYRDYMQTYTKGGNHDVFGRFVEYFVEKAQQPGIETFEQFEARWKQWIQDLEDVHFGPAEKADVLLERARAQVANGKLEYARETYGRALDKRPDDARALYERAQVLLGLGGVDGGLLDYRRVIRLARSQPDAAAPMPGFGEQSAAEVLADCLARITEVNDVVGAAVGETDAAFVSATKEAAGAFAEAGFPRGAVYLIETSIAVLGGDASLAGLAAEIRSEKGIDLRRWRRFALEGGLELWEAGAGWSAAGEELRLATDGLVTCTRRGEMPEAYRLEARIRPGKPDKEAMFGLVFGSNSATGAKGFALAPQARAIGLVALKEGGDVDQQFEHALKPDAKEYLLALEVTPGHVEFFLDHKRVGSVDLPRRELLGRVGVFGQDTEAVFADVRVRY